MWESEVHIDINAPAADVYSYLADFPRHREWSSANMSELKQLTPGPVGVGSEFEAAETAPSRIVTYSRITALEPARRIAWHSWFGKLMAADWEFDLSEKNGSRTWSNDRDGSQATSLWSCSTVWCAAVASRSRTIKAWNASRPLSRGSLRGERPRP